MASGIPSSLLMKLTPDGTALDIATGEGYSRYMQNQQAWLQGIQDWGGDNFGKDGKGGKNTKPTTPATPPPQWAFKPSPYDQAPTMGGGDQPGGGGGAGGGLPSGNWNVQLATQPWMLNPGGQQPQQQQPQIDPNTGQPIGLDYYNQWALNPFAGY